MESASSALRRRDASVTAESARQLADDFLLMEVGDLLSAGDPLFKQGQRPRWEVPILLSNAAQGELGEVGRLWLDAETGTIELTEEDRREVKAHARTLSLLAASTAGA